MHGIADRQPAQALQHLLQGFAIDDANADNLRSVNEWLAMSRSQNLAQLRAALDTYQGLPWMYTLATDTSGTVYFADASVAPHVKSGRVRVLAVTMAKRSTLNPEWPTLQQEGVKEIDASNWTALFAPKATPQPIIDKLNAEVVKILNMPDVKERFAGGGVVTIPSSAAELDARVKQEAERFRAIVQKANIRPD